MKRAFMALAFIFAPVVAQAEISQVECANAAGELAVLASAFNVVSNLASVEDIDGWCVLSDGALGGATLQGAKFRWVDLGAVRKISLLIDELKTADEVYEFDAKFDFNIDTKETNLTSMSARSSEGHGVTARGSFTLGAAEQLGASVAEASISSLSAQVFVTSDVLSYAVAADIIDARDLVTDALNGANFGQVDRQSRREVTRFLTALPNAQGRMDVSVQSAKGTKIAQFGAPFIGVAQSEVGTALERALDGVQVQLRWNPGRM